jgi:hypothetical protein
MRGRPVRPWIGLVPMMEARRRSALVTRLVTLSGTSMASLVMRKRWVDDLEWPGGGWTRTRFLPSGRRTPARSSSRTSSPSRVRTGSSPSASCSAISPVSVHDDSVDSADSDDRPSWAWAASRVGLGYDVDRKSRSERRGSVRKGMLDGRRLGVGSGMLGGDGAV